MAFLVESMLPHPLKERKPLHTVQPGEIEGMYIAPSDAGMLPDAIHSVACVDFRYQEFVLFQ